jgi:hypothetical protein
LGGAPNNGLPPKGTDLYRKYNDGGTMPLTSQISTEDPSGIEDSGALSSELLEGKDDYIVGMKKGNSNILVITINSHNLCIGCC